MKRIRQTLLLIAILLPATPFAQDNQDEARELRESGAILPLEEILEQARDWHTGKVLDVKLEKERGRYIYEVELLDERGKVWEVEVDAQNGTVLNRERD